VCYNSASIEVQLPGTFPDKGKDLTVIRLKSGEEVYIDHSGDEVPELIADATQFEYEW
jgi:hypothetical protein